MTDLPVRTVSRSPLRRPPSLWAVLPSGDGPALGDGFRETVDRVECDREHDERALALPRLGHSRFALSAAWCAVRASILLAWRLFDRHRLALTPGLAGAVTAGFLRRQRPPPAPPSRTQP